jgi:hypothetical protein
VVNALADMQHSMCRSVAAAQSYFAQFQGGFVGQGLLRGNDRVEINFELGPRGGE